MSGYRASAIAEYYDRYGDREWARFERTPLDEVKLHVHLAHLRKYARTGMRVLEVGAGPGRFTRELARLGCIIEVTDVSQVQLSVNRERASREGFAESVSNWRLADVVNLEELSDESFELVLCYGGPISYALDMRARAVSECGRVLSRGGVFLLSVMSLWGTIHSALDGVMKVPRAANDRIVETGDLTAEVLPGHEHPCHLFKADELCTLLEDSGLEVLSLSASNSLSTAWDLEAIRKDGARWEELLELELQSCESPGCVDLGTHIIAAGRKGRPV